MKNLKENLINLATKELNDIAISMIKASETYKNHFSSIKMILLLDELLETQFRNSLSIIINTFEYMDLLKKDFKYFDKKDIGQSLTVCNNSSIDIKSDSFRTFAFVIFEIIILINDSIDNEKISKYFLSNFTLILSKLFILEKEYLKSNISMKAIQEILTNRF